MLNEALRLVRVFHDLNKSEAASRVGLSKSYITELERGDKNVTIDVLNKYAQAFDLPISSLMLFAEHAAAGTTEKTRVFVADKALRMLEWIEMITAEEEHS